MAPFIDLWIDGDGVQALRALGNDDPGAALIQFEDDPIGIEGFVCDEGGEGDPFDQRRDTDRVVALPRQQNEANQIAECVGKCENLRRQAASGLADGLALSPPFAPCPWR